MSEILDSYEFARGPKSKYPWDEWTSGATYRVRRGEDFATSVSSFAKLLRNRGSRDGLSVRVREEDDATVVFQFVAREKRAT